MSTINRWNHTLRELDRTSLLLLAVGLPIAGFFFLLWAIPITYGLTVSFFADPLNNPEFVGLGNYTHLLGEELFWTAFLNSAVYAVSSTLLSLVIGLGLALAVNQQLRGGNALRTLMLFPYLLPTIVVVFLWRFLLDQHLGLINQALLLTAIIDSPIAFFRDTTWAMPSVIVTSTWKYASFAFFIILARLQSIDASLYERARIEGATSWQAFRDITLPQIKNAILLIIFIRGIWMFNTFDIIWIATGGGPLDTTTTIPIMIYRVVFSQFAFGQGAALASILFLILVGVAIVFFTLFDPEGVDNS